MATLTHVQYLRSHTDFFLAEVFRPDEAPALAAQCLLPVADVLAAGRERAGVPESYLTVEALVAYVGQEEVPQNLIYEAWVADIVATLRGWTARWPRLWRDPVRAYVAAEYAVQMDDPRDLAALAREASAALWEAIEALYGEEAEVCLEAEEAASLAAMARYDARAVEEAEAKAAP